MIVPCARFVIRENGESTESPNLDEGFDQLMPITVLNQANGMLGKNVFHDTSVDIR